MRVDGAIEQVSEPQPDFGSVIVNAVQNGFRPKENSWVVITGERYTHFAPGQPPVTIPPDGRPMPLADHAALLRTKGARGPTPADPAGNRLSSAQRSEEDGACQSARTDKPRRPV